MTKIKGKDIRVKLTSSLLSFPGVKSEQIKLSARFDEERDKDTGDGPYRSLEYVGFTATINGRIKDSAEGVLSLAQIEELAKTGKLSDAVVSGAVYVGTDVLVTVDRVIIENFSKTDPVDGPEEYSVTLRGTTAVELPY